MTYKEKLLDPRWRRKRLEILARDEYTCTHCQQTNVELHVHHNRYSESRNPWDIENEWLQTLCKDCHEALEYSKTFTGLLAEIYEWGHWVAFQYEPEYLKHLNRMVLAHKKRKR